MTLLNRASNGHVASLVAVWRTVRAVGPMTRPQLIALCGAGAPENKVAMTLSTWRALGLFEEDAAEKVKLASEFENIETDDLDALRSAVFRLLMQPRSYPFLTENAGEAPDLASDFVRTATWALAQDPYGIACFTQEEVLERAQKQNLPHLFEGGGRWTSFQDWAFFCGLGLPVPNDAFVLNPARAIRTVLNSPRLTKFFRSTVDMPIREFIRMLAEEVPLLEGGTIRVRIDETIGRAKGFTEELRLSPCTSLALMQLEHEGELILLDTAADVASRFSLTGQAHTVLQGCSHVRRGTQHRLADGNSRRAKN